MMDRSPRQHETREHDVATRQTGRFAGAGDVARLMLRTLAAVTAAWPLSGGYAAASERGGDPLDAWIGEVRSCTHKDVPRLTVVGFHLTETAVSPEEAENIRLDIEGRLKKAGGLELTSGADVVRLKKLREETTGLPPAEAEAQILRAFDGAAAIFFVSPDRQTGHMRFHLQAITSTADCKATSEPIELALSGAQSLADAGQVMANAVKHLVEAAPNVRFVDVLPFSARGGHSACSAALAETLMVALAAEARDPGRVMNGKTMVAAKVTVPGPAEAGRVTAYGTFDLDRDNRAFVGLEFKGEGGATIAPTGRVAIAIDRLACDPAIRPFLDYVAAGALTDRSRLDLIAPAFAPNQRLEARITLSRPLSLYCLLVAPDGSGYAAPRVNGQAGILRYPRDFGLGDAVAEDRFENLLDCFGTERDLPAVLDRQWREYAPEAAPDAKPKLIEPAALTALINAFRAQPDIVETTARIVVR